MAGDRFSAISVSIKLSNLTPRSLTDLAKPLEHLGSFFLLAVLNTPTFLKVLKREYRWLKVRIVYLDCCLAGLYL